MILPVERAALGENLFLLVLSLVDSMHQGLKKTHFKNRVLFTRPGRPCFAVNLTFGARWGGVSPIRHFALNLSSACV